jgi:DNA-binding beta-propeller fold protein YncE
MADVRKPRLRALTVTTGLALSAALAGCIPPMRPILNDPRVHNPEITYDATQLPGDFGDVLDLTVDASGALVVLDGGQAIRLEADGTRHELGVVPRDQGPHSVAVGPDGTTYVSASQVSGIRSESLDGHSFGGISAPDFIRGLAVAPQGVVYAVDAIGQRILRAGPGEKAQPWSGPSDGTAGFQDGDAAAARFRDPGALALGPDGRLYVLDRGNNALRVLTPDGACRTLTEAPTARPAAQPGLDGQTDLVRFRQPTDLTVDAAGRVFVADLDRVLMVGTGGFTSTVVMGGEPCVGPVPTVDSFCDEAGKPTFGHPRAIAAGPEGVLYVSDTTGHHVWRFVPRP